MAGNINNIEDLRREKELIKLKMRITQQAFLHSLGENRRQVQRLVINKIALPVGAGALVSWLMQLLTKKKMDDAQIMGDDGLEPGEPQPWWLPLARTLLTFLETFLDRMDPADHGSSSENGNVVRAPERRENL